jgi:hypothetical protein
MVSSPLLDRGSETVSRGVTGDSRWKGHDLAAHCGLHRTFVGNIEWGLKNTTILTLMMISRALGISVAELLRGLEKRVEEGRRRAAK